MLAMSSCVHPIETVKETHPVVILLEILGHHGLVSGERLLPAGPFTSARGALQTRLCTLFTHAEVCLCVASDTERCLLDVVDKVVKPVRLGVISCGHQVPPNALTAHLSE